MAVPQGNGGFTTTTAKDNTTKLMFNFTSGPQQPVIGSQKQQLQSHQRQSSLDRNLGDNQKKSISKSNLLGQAPSQALNTTTSDRIGRYNDLRASLRIQ